MVQLSILFLVHVCPALLPPTDPDDRDYYDILGIPRDSSNEAIRKAYKKKSLQLHPDKVQQRGGNQEEARAEYEQVQEAYGVLVNDEKRQRYHSLGCSPTRYQFLQRGSLGNPAAMYENLTGASFVDKTRLVALASVLLMVLLVQPILICSKLNHTLEQQGALEDTPWTLILIPFWVLYAFVILFWLVLLALAPAGAARGSVVLGLLQHVAWYVGVIFLALKWDGTWTSDYATILIPIYIAMALQWGQLVVALRKIKYDVDRMISPEFLEREVLKGKSMEELTEDERNLILQEFLLVTVPADFVPDNEDGTLDEKGLEEQRVQASAEYDGAIEMYNSAFASLMRSFIFGTTFLIVLTLKLDGSIDSNWWTVFTPLWVYYGSLIIYNSFTCLCGGVAGEEVMLNTMAAQQEAQEQAEQDRSQQNDGAVPAEGNVASSTTSADFDNPEASIRKTTTTPPKEEAKGEEAAAEDEQKISKDPTTQENSAISSPRSESKDAEQTKASNTADTTEAADGKNAGTTDEEGKDEEPHFHMDEDTFKAFQNAYEQAEEDAMKEQAKIISNCCSYSFQMMLLCLVVAKLEQAYRNDDPDDVGFDVYWIIFPFLLFFGLICLCCACLIYGASPGSASDFEENGPEEGDEENPASPDESPIAMPPPPSVDDEKKASVPAPTTTSPETAKSEDEVTPANVSEEKTETPSSKKVPATQTSSMEDLD